MPKIPPVASDARGHANPSTIASASRLATDWSWAVTPIASCGTRSAMAVPPLKTVAPRAPTANPSRGPAARTVHHPHHHGGDHHQKRLADRDGHSGDQDVPDIGLRSQCGAVGIGDDRADDNAEGHSQRRGRRRWPPRCRASRRPISRTYRRNRMGRPNATVAIIGACHRSTAKPASAAARTSSPAPKRLRERGGSCGNRDVVNRGVSTRCAGAAAYAPRRRCPVRPTDCCAPQAPQNLPTVVSLPHAGQCAVGKAYPPPGRVVPGDGLRPLRVEEIAGEVVDVGASQSGHQVVPG